MTEHGNMADRVERMWNRLQDQMGPCTTRGAIYVDAAEVCILAEAVMVLLEAARTAKPEDTQREAEGRSHPNLSRLIEAAEEMLGLLDSDSFVASDGLNAADSHEADRLRDAVSTARSKGE